MPDDELDNRREWVWELEDAFRANIASILAGLVALAAAGLILLAAGTSADALGVMWLYQPEVYARIVPTAALALYAIGFAAGYVLASTP